MRLVAIGHHFQDEHLRGDFLNSEKPTYAAFGRDESQALILEHSRNPLNFGTISNPQHSGSEENPVCGDRCQVMLLTDQDRVKQIRFTGRGCAISLASASIMTELVDGLSLSSIGDVINSVQRYFAERAAIVDTDLGDLVALNGVRELPMRVKCATLPWNALLNAIE